MHERIRIWIAREDFAKLTDAVKSLNTRTKKLNREAKKRKYCTITRTPCCYNNVSVQIEFSFPDRASILWNEFTEIIDRFSISYQRPANLPKPTFGVWIPCKDLEEANALNASLQCAVVTTKDKL